MLGSIIGSMFGGNTISKSIDSIARVVDSLFTSDDERLSAEALMEKLRQNPHVLQAEITKNEARHKSLFVAGARPFILWVCGIGLACAFIIFPILQLFSLPIPVMPLELMYNLVLALVGLGGLRTYEKIKGVHSDTFKIRKDIDE